MKLVKATLPGLVGLRDVAVLEGDTHIGKWVEETKRLDHDQNSLPVLQRIIPEDAVIYDIGAHIGDHTAFFLSLRPRFVCAFEAYEDACECLRHNVGPYRVRHAILETAVGNGEGIQLAESKGSQNYGARHMLAGEIQSVKIDKLQVLPRPTFIQIDVEGWECKALLGAEQTIHESSPIIVCEVNRGALVRAGDSPEKLHEILTGWGYEMRDLYTDEPWNPADDRPLFDVVARRK